LLKIVIDIPIVIDTTRHREERPRISLMRISNGNRDAAKRRCAGKPGRDPNKKPGSLTGRYPPGLNRKCRRRAGGTAIGEAQTTNECAKKEAAVAGGLNSFGETPKLLQLFRDVLELAVEA
jgi:hypothetical protein